MIEASYDYFLKNYLPFLARKFKIDKISFLKFSIDFQATHVITSHELLPKFKNILPHAPSVTTIVYFEHQIKSTSTTGFPENVQIVPFYDVVHNGRKLIKDVNYAPIQNAPTK